MTELTQHLATLLLLSAVVAVISRTVTQEQIFSELREWAKRRATALGRKIAYPLTCQYCFSHWVAAGLTAIVGYVAVQTGNAVYDFALTVFFLVAVANGLMIAYELATVKVRVQRTIDNFNLAQIELSQTLIAEHKLENELRKLSLESTQIQMDGIRKLKAVADEHNAKVEVEQAKANFPGSFVGGN